VHGASPSKSVTGLLGGLLLGSAALALTSGDPGQGRWGGHWGVWVNGLVLSALAEAGDLIESLVKRAAGVKVSPLVRVHSQGGALI
jgi:CDP-diglyceride synthetase